MPVVASAVPPLALLHKLGYQVVAVSGRESTHEYLKSLEPVVFSLVMSLPESRPLEKQVWAGAIDTVGDKVLAKVLAQNELRAAAWRPVVWRVVLLPPTTVMPFILRNVRLQGVDSVMTPPERRAQAPQRLVADLPESFYTMWRQRDISVRGTELCRGHH